MTQHYDMAVIGSGPAGHGAAIQAAKLGKRVVVIDDREMLGGTSVTLGSVPSKTLREAVLFLTGFRQRAIYGIDYSVKPRLAIEDLAQRCDSLIRSQSAIVRNQLARNGVDVLIGEASFRAPDLLHVDRVGPDDEIGADVVVLAVGSAPASSETVRVNGSTIIDSDGVYGLQRIPRSLTVVGAGVVGIEFACFFAALGVEVTVVDQRQRVLEFLDAEILHALIYQMRQQDVLFRLGEEVTAVEEGPKGVVAHTASRKKISGEVLLYAVGRRGTTSRLGLEAAGLTADDRGRVIVDEHFQTSVPNIYAVGDVVGFPALAATAAEQGRDAARHAFGMPLGYQPQRLPYGLYTIPEISMVGRNEEQLTFAGVPYEVGLAHYRETARGQIIGDTAGLLKLLVHSETKEILGVHIIGEGAAELVHIGQMAIVLGGRLDVLLENTFNYPTLAECYRIAALDASNKLE